MANEKKEKGIGVGIEELLKIPSINEALDKKTYLEKKKLSPDDKPEIYRDLGRGFFLLVSVAGKPVEKKFTDLYLEKYGVKWQGNTDNETEEKNVDELVKSLLGVDDTSMRRLKEGYKQMAGSPAAAPFTGLEEDGKEVISHNLRRTTLYATSEGEIGLKTQINIVALSQKEETVEYDVTSTIETDWAPNSEYDYAYDFKSMNIFGRDRGIVKTLFEDGYKDDFSFSQWSKSAKTDPRGLVESICKRPNPKEALLEAAKNPYVYQEIVEPIKLVKPRPELTIQEHLSLINTHREALSGLDKLDLNTTINFPKPYQAILNEATLEDKLLFFPHYLLSPQEKLLILRDYSPKVAEYLEENDGNKKKFFENFEDNLNAKEKLSLLCIYANKMPERIEKIKPSFFDELDNQLVKAAGERKHKSGHHVYHDLFDLSKNNNPDESQIKAMKTMQEKLPGLYATYAKSWIPSSASINYRLNMLTKDSTKNLARFGEPFLTKLGNDLKTLNLDEPANNSTVNEKDQEKIKDILNTTLSNFDVNTIGSTPEDIQFLNKMLQDFYVHKKSAGELGEDILAFVARQHLKREAQEYPRYDHLLKMGEELQNTPQEKEAYAQKAQETLESIKAFKKEQQAFIQEAQENFLQENHEEQENFLQLANAAQEAQENFPQKAASAFSHEDQTYFWEEVKADFLRAVAFQKKLQAKHPQAEQAVPHAEQADYPEENSQARDVQTALLQAAKAAKTAQAAQKEFLQKTPEAGETDQETLLRLAKTAQETQKDFVQKAQEAFKAQAAFFRGVQEAHATFLKDTQTYLKSPAALTEFLNQESAIELGEKILAFIDRKMQGKEANISVGYLYLFKIADELQDNPKDKNAYRKAIIYTFKNFFDQKLVKDPSETLTVLLKNFIDPKQIDKFPDATALINYAVDYKVPIPTSFDAQKVVEILNQRSDSKEALYQAASQNKDIYHELVSPKLTLPYVFRKVGEFVGLVKPRSEPTILEHLTLMNTHQLVDFSKLLESNNIKKPYLAILNKATEFEQDLFRKSTANPKEKLSFLEESFKEKEKVETIKRYSEKSHQSFFNDFEKDLDLKEKLSLLLIYAKTMPKRISVSEKEKTTLPKGCDKNFFATLDMQLAQKIKDKDENTINLLKDLFSLKNNNSNSETDQAIQNIRYGLQQSSAAYEVYKKENPMDSAEEVQSISQNYKLLKEYTPKVVGSFSAYSTTPQKLVDPNQENQTGGGGRGGEAPLQVGKSVQPALVENVNSQNDDATAEEIESNVSDTLQKIDDDIEPAQKEVDSLEQRAISVEEKKESPLKDPATSITTPTLNSSPNE